MDVYTLTRGEGNLKKKERTFLSIKLGYNEQKNVKTIKSAGVRQGHDF